MNGSAQSLRLYSSAAVAADIPPKQLFLFVFGSISFNLFLCLIHTHAFGVSNFHVMAIEAIIISGVFLTSYRFIDQGFLIIFSCAILWALTLASIRVVIGTEDSIDIKIVRDLTIPFAFFLLGTRITALQMADRVVVASAMIVFVIGLFEYFSLETFTRIFDVAGYYIARGTMDAADALQSDNLFISGMRPEAASAGGGRNLLPFLGGHRVSSIFLEPVSMGNFGVIVFMWGLVRSKFDRMWHVAPMLLGLALIIMADSRFGAYLCVIAVAIIFVPTVIANMVAFSIPLLAMALLSIVPMMVTGSYDPQNRYADNTSTGRLVLSAQMLGSFDFLTWMGLRPPYMEAFDSGYAYIIAGIGFIGFLAAWILLFSLRGPSLQFYAFRNLTALYYGLILCISNSPFTIKTAALLWMLIGALSVGIRSRIVGSATSEILETKHSPGHQADSKLGSGNERR